MLHPGMMHTLMSFLWCIGTLMKASYVDVRLTAAFGGVVGIMAGKSCVPTVSLRQYCSGISSRVASRRTKSCASTRRQPESTRLRGSGGLSNQALSSSIAVTENRRLHTPACQPRDDDAQIICGQHMIYARYMSWYLRNVENLPTAAKNDQMKGAHVCRHSDVGTA